MEKLSNVCSTVGVRWAGQAIGTDAPETPGTLPGLGQLSGLVRSVTTPEFAGVTFHEVLARSALNKVPSAAQLPFAWTVNPYRGCTHACVYCFARGTHAYLDLDTGQDFDRQIIVKTNVADVLARELRRPSWPREPVALGTNTDPYQRAEGRYRLMPGIIRALAASGTPFSVLTKGTTARRDIPLLRTAAEEVSVGFGVSIAVGDEDLHELIEPGTPSPRARLDLVAALRDAGLPCQVMLAPVLPCLTDSDEALDALLERIASAGATGATVFALHLRPGAREWYRSWLERHRPGLVAAYADLYGSGTYAARWYREDLARRVAPLLIRHGLRRPHEGALRPTREHAEKAPQVATPTLF